MESGLSGMASTKGMCVKLVDGSEALDFAELALDFADGGLALAFLSSTGGGFAIVLVRSAIPEPCALDCNTAAITSKQRSNIGRQIALIRLSNAIQIKIYQARRLGGLSRGLLLLAGYMRYMYHWMRYMPRAPAPCMA